MIRLLILVMLVAWPTVALAQVCGKHTAVLENLEAAYGEKPAAMGLGNDGSVIEVVVSDEGTFTILVTRPSGETCVMATGTSWENHPNPEGQKI